MQNINELHRKINPEKALGNFWKSQDYAHALASLAPLTAADVRKFEPSARGKQACTMVHPIVAIAFMRWANPVLFYKRLQRIIES